MKVLRTISQGITARSHKQAVADVLTLPDIDRVLIGVAFVSADGAHQISAELKAFASKTTVFAGIRNDITSLQGLEALLSMSGRLYAVDMGSRGLLFHPKLYLARNSSVARVLIGSANLTLGGLNNNVEFGVLLEAELADQNDAQTIADIEKSFDSLISKHGSNVERLKSKTHLLRLVASGRLVDETIVAPPRPHFVPKPGTKDLVPRFRSALTPLKSTVRKVGKARSQKRVAGLDRLKPSTGTSALEVVWQSTPLTRRDLTIPQGASTNQTGSINLDKGLLAPAIDHRSYFRQTVFNALTWVPNKTGTVETATATFEIVVKGVSVGETDLMIRHTTSTTSKTYQQKNAMTRLSWGAARPFIAKPTLIGRTMTLYRDAVDQKRFLIEID